MHFAPRLIGGVDFDTRAGSPGISDFPMPWNEDAFLGSSIEDNEKYGFHHPGKSRKSLLLASL